MGFARVGSNPTVVDNFLRAIPFDTQFVLVAQWIAHQTSDLGVGGSSPPRDFFFVVFALFPLVILVGASLAEWLRRWL